MKFVLAAVLFCFALFAADEVIPHRQDRVPNQPFTAQEAIKRMTVPSGFEVEIVAAEPNIVNPIAMTFDDRGRIWITESVEYPRKEAGRGGDRVKILEDTDGDGRADRFTVFAEGLNIPTGVAVGYGGIWVLNSPDLLFLKEKDGKEIGREVILKGFGRTDMHELPSSLTWGPDGWLYGLNGVFNESRIVANGKTNKFTCAMWRVHPRTHEFQIVCEGTSNPYGIAWDHEGSAIVEACHWATDHLFHFVETGYYHRQAGAYPPYSFILGSITDHGHQKTAYCGICFFDSDAYPESYRGKIYVGNIHGGCINVDSLERDGATYLGKGEPDFLTANDAWFMPVAQKVGPDGCIYILDWYDRYHCYQDANRDAAGVDRERGRLYRVRYKNSPRAPQFDLAKETNDQLIARLGSPNIYFRETTQQLLSERNSDTANRDLQQLILEPAVSRVKRMHALWSLIGTGSLDERFHQQLLADADPGVRAWAVRAAGNFGTVADSIRSRVASLASDPSPDVQLQVAIAARKLMGKEALPVLMQILRACGNDKMIPPIVWPNLHPLLETGPETFIKNIRDGSSSPAIHLLWPRFIDRLLGAAKVDAASVAALARMGLEPSMNRGAESLSAISSRVGELSADTVARLQTELRPVLETILDGPRGTTLYLSAQLLSARLGMGTGTADTVRQQFISAKSNEGNRLQALEALIAFRDARLPELLPPVLTNGSLTFRTKLLGILGHGDNPRIADILLNQYNALEPAIKPLAIDLIMQRETWAAKLLSAVKEKRVPPSALNANHLRKILETNDREAIWEVERIWGTVRDERNPEREKVVVEMTDYLKRHWGNPRKGQLVFRNFCAQCHTIYGEGGKVGPDITANGRSSFDQLLSNVFDPSLVIGPAYQVTTVVTHDGRNLTGLVKEQNEHRITLTMPGEGEESIPLNNVKYSHVSKLSMMPEGIETLLNRQDISDLFAFLSLDQPPDDPRAQPIPGSPRPGPGPDGTSGKKIQISQSAQRLTVLTKTKGQWTELLEYVTDPGSRPYLHPVRDASGSVALTADRPSDHPWQHGIFTGFHGLVNGHEYWMEKDGRHHFVRLTNIVEKGDCVAWSSVTEFIEPDGAVAMEEEDQIKVEPPDALNRYRIDFTLMVRARDKDVLFGKANVGGLAVRMPWDQKNPRQTHLNSEGDRGRDCERKRAAWCNVERPFEEKVFGIAVFDHPGNEGYPSVWRVDEQGLINPSITALTDWTLPAGKERRFEYRILIYPGTMGSRDLDSEAQRFREEQK